MSFPFLPLVTGESQGLLDALNRIGPVIISSEKSAPALAPTSADHPYLIFQSTTNPVDLDHLVQLLNEGIEKLILPLSWAKEAIGVIPAERLVVLLDGANVSAVSDSIRNGVSGVLLKTASLDLDFVTSISQFFAGSPIYVLSTSSALPALSTVRQLQGIGANLVLPEDQLTLGPSSDTHLNVTDVYLASVVSDRKDGLFPTIVSTETGHSLGLVYSSRESVNESIVSGKGVYQSRKHGLWRKGETSGATQDVVSIRLDCDCDSLEFRVVQHGAGFCHLNRQSCFGEASGLPALENVLSSRLQNAPEGSYTHRLFNDPALLRSKIMEEADELCTAETREEVAFEAADLLYFALTKCTAAGVTIADIEKSLELKSKRITRRPGNAKPQFVTKEKTTAAPAPSNPAPPTSGIISMSTYDLATSSPEQYSLLLRRPVLNSNQMIDNVKPIVNEVRDRGDQALLDFTAKFDRVKIDYTVIFPPFAPETMVMDSKVRDAINVAYSNIWKFHKAQTSNSVLTVETMPGVKCSRFARPITRVGLYIPGGTAILPSTALMLGIPAQVAGCKEIVFATPPRSDGSISPEVMYVAKLVGATAILKAGGAQAVAALAYGTETVPKVDKIFGPGNQWVTAAKMLVQNDTDALVSIDMPAGPSEVLVIADKTSNPAFVASDLLSQAEHGVDSQVVLVAVDLTEEHLSEIEAEVNKQALLLERVDIVRVSISKSNIVKVATVDEGIAFSNDYAPEHLILHLENASEKVSQIDNAGSIFVGPYTPESCGDYASGTNHTLPTNGYARQFSGVNTLSFQKHITSQEITEEGLGGLGPYVVTLADCEGLQAHANAVRIRLSTMSS
ncbi:histidine biosynthesis trifunctional-protein [Coprinopsis marcescibilis]|uniref:Histidine biosynthesis trifunctional protein n=1 Tax=Coprinopsis marcescibilis TaxID=230819 RepID=A0A5C3L9H1_COPMA|nr:histidine biosynthesis trifunctional-protein [Coprinopsis marcescibilis]